MSFYVLKSVMAICSLKSAMYFCTAYSVWTVCMCEAASIVNVTKTARSLGVLSVVHQSAD